MRRLESALTAATTAFLLNSVGCSLAEPKSYEELQATIDCATKEKKIIGPDQNGYDAVACLQRGLKIKLEKRRGSPLPRSRRPLDPDELYM